MRLTKKAAQAAFFVFGVSYFVAFAISARISAIVFR